jgi:hypothetical protein
MDPSPEAPRTPALSDPPADPEADRLVRALLEVTGERQVRAILLFGSHMVQASPDRFSAYDLVVVVEDYRAFYDALARAQLSRRSPVLQAALSRVLAPNVIALAPQGWEAGGVAKIMAIEPAALERALSAESPDHFIKGRLIQKVALLHERDAETRRWLGELLERARGEVLEWVGPFLPDSFDAEGAARRMLETSYGGEVRPEAGDRVAQVFAAQRDFLERMMQGVLDDGVRRHVLRKEGGTYRFVRPPTERDRRRVRGYFRRSKARATARWMKHVMTFDNWLDYIARKVERRRGMRVQITPWERRLPYLLLWPKVVRVLRARPARLDASSADRSSRGTGAK